MQSWSVEVLQRPANAVRPPELPPGDDPSSDLGYHSVYTSTSPTMFQRSIRSWLLLTASRPTARFAAVPKHRYYTNEPSLKASSENAPIAKPGDSAMIRQEGAAGGQPRHQPDYNVAIDYRTS
jgi:hypothetical protein